MKISLTNGLDRVDFIFAPKLQTDPDECNTVEVQLAIGNLRYHYCEEFLTPELTAFGAAADLPRLEPLQLHGIGLALTIARQDNTGHYQVKIELDNPAGPIVLKTQFIVATLDLEQFGAGFKSLCKIKE